MKRYNVEIFERDFSLRDHTVVGDISYSEDYLAPVDNEITVFNVSAEKGDYIRICNGEDEFFGIIKSVASQDKKTMTISYSSFLSVFETSVLFDTDLQGTSTLEAVMANMIDELFISNSDSVQNITGLSVATSSSTSSWGFNLKSDTEGMHHCIVDFYSVFIARALEKYSIVITVTPDIQAKTISLVIGKISGTKTIETDLPNVVEKNIVIKETEKDVNKLVVYDTADYTTKRTYYRYPDYTYGTTDTNRITPVVQEIHAVSVEESSTFARTANSDAADVFGNIEYNNLIELIILNNDTLIRPYEMKIGQVTNVISKGVSYTSILTGKTVADRTQLTFGTIRLDLTKIIKRRFG